MRARPPRSPVCLTDSRVAEKRPLPRTSKGCKVTREIVAPVDGAARRIQREGALDAAGASRSNRIQR